MSTTSAQLSADIAQLHADAGKMHDVIHGLASQTVQTDGGPVRTVANAIATLAAINFRGAWQAATNYAMKDAFTTGGIIYVAVVGHKSTTITADLAAGNIALYQGTVAQKTDVFSAGVDFTAGVTTQLTLSRDPGTKENIEVFFGAGFQGPNQYGLLGTTLTFNSAIPVGTIEVFVKIGVAMSALSIPNGSIDDDSVEAGSKLSNRLTGLPDVRDVGGIGDGVANAAVALSIDAPAMLVPSGTYRVSSDATITAELFFAGGRIRVPVGVTLTLQRAPRAGSGVIFEGGGSVVIQSGVIDVSWFDGADASAKWAFASRQLNNSNALSKMVAFPTPKPTDAWAVLSDLGQWGYGWACDSPIDVTQLAGETQFITPAPFVARKPIPALWRMGVGAAKVDGWHFPMKLLLDGNSKNVNGMEIQGASTFSINFIEAQWCVSGLVIRPTGTKQVSGFTIGQVMVGGNTGTGIIIDGSTNTSTGVTDGIIQFPNGVGAKISGVDSFVEISGTVQNLHIPRVSARAVNAGMFDYNLAAVTIQERNGFAPSRGIEIGYVLTDAAVSSTAKAVHIAGSASVKVTGVSIGGAIAGAGVSPAVSIDNCDWIKIRNVELANVLIGAGASHTRLFGVSRSNVTDNGTDTQFDGHSYGAPISLPAPGTGNPYTNNNLFHVMYTISGATTLTGATYVRPGRLPVNIGASGSSGAWMLAPGDNISVSYTGSPSFNAIPI